MIHFGKLEPVRINFMAAGIGGIGKSTFLKSFFNLYQNAIDVEKLAAGSTTTKNSALLEDRTMNVEEVGHYVIEATNVDIHFHLAETSDFGDQINNKNAINMVREYLETAHRQWSTLNTRAMTRKEINAADNRLHCVFYFISPHRMTLLDSQFIQQLGSLAVVVPIIAKADTMTLEERGAYLKVVEETLRTIRTNFQQPIIFDFQEGDDQAGLLSPLQQDGRVVDSICVVADSCDAGEESSPVKKRCSLEIATSPDDQTDANLRGTSQPSTGSDSRGAGNLRFTSSLLNLTISDASGENHLLGASCSYLLFPSSSNLSSDSLTLSPRNPFYSPSAGNGRTPYPTPSYVSPASGNHRFTMSDYQDEYNHSHSSSEADEVKEDEEGQNKLNGRDSPLPVAPRLRNVFAVVCSTDPSGLRQYPWGSVDMYSEQHSDFSRLQGLIFGSKTCVGHLQKMREQTDQLSVAQYQRCQQYGLLFQAQRLWQKLGARFGSLVVSPHLGWMLGVCVLLSTVAWPLTMGFRDFLLKALLTSFRVADAIEGQS